MSEPTLDDILSECAERCRSMDAPLALRLQTFAAEVGRASPEFADIVDRMIARLRQHEVGVGAPRPGDAMPNFLLPDEKGRLRSLSDYTSSGPVVIAFHRGHWCPYCLINATALTNVYSEIVAAGGSVVAITPEVERFNAELKSIACAPFPVLSDMDNGYALLLNLAFYIGEEKRRFMSQAGWSIPPYNGNETWTLPIPATFVVGRDGIVAARFIDPDFRKRMDVQEILSVLKRLAGGAP